MKLHALQYLRAIAALVVVYSHACIQVPSYQARLMEFGSFGVDIFFVISGFIMLFITKPTDKPISFMINRVRRVVPLYWFFTVLMAVLYLAMPSLFKNAAITFSAFIQSLFFIPHFSAAHTGEIWPIVAPGWSLNFEMYFYALFALSLFLAMQFRLAFIAVVITLMFIAAHVLNSGGAINQFLKDATVFEFIFGMLLAHFWRAGWRLSSRTGAILLVTGFALLLLHSQKLGLAAMDMPGIITYGIPSAMVVAGSLFVVVPVNKLGLLLGDASYALYLSHIFVLGLLRKILPPLLGDTTLAAILFTLISLAVCLIVSVPVHTMIDNWVLRHERLGTLGALKKREA